MPLDDPTTTEGVNAWHWIYQDLGLVMDIFFLFQDDAAARNSYDTGVIAAQCYGMGDLGMAIWASIGQTGWPVAANILPVIPEVCKFLRYSKIALNPAYAPYALGALAGADVLFTWDGCLINLVQSWPGGAQLAATA